MMLKKKTEEIVVVITISQLVVDTGDMGNVTRDYTRLSKYEI